jgi:hypothetical protein
MPIGELDPSWVAVLNFAAERRLKFGSDIIFTYGPLGFLFQPIGFGDFQFLRILFAVAFSTLTTFAGVRLATRINGVSRMIFLLWLVIFPNIQVSATLVFVYMILAFTAFTLLDDVPKSQWTQRMLLLAVSVLALVKFTFFLPALGVMTICITYRVLAKNGRRAWDIVFFFTGSLLLSWLLAGQALEDFPLYLRASQQIVAGYGDAMSLPPKRATLHYGLMAIGLWLVASVIVLAKVERLRMSIIAALMIVGSLAFMSWKQGFVRADGHVLLFLDFLPVAFGLISHRIIANHLSQFERGVILTCYVLSVAFCILATTDMSPKRPYSQLMNWGERIPVDTRSLLSAIANDQKRSLFLETYEMRPEDRLPQVVGKIGDSSIDVINYRQAVALLNGLNYRPRPVIQSYSAYTPALQQANLDFYRSDRRPRYILFTLETIDNRFPTLDDAPTIAYVLNNYRIILAEGNFLLMELRPGNPHNVTYKRVHQASVKIGEKLDLKPWNNLPLFLRISATPSLRTRVLNLLYQPPAYNLSVEMEGGAKKKSFRFIPRMTGYGFLANPLLESNEDVIDLLTGDHQKRVDNVAVVKVGRFVELETPITIEIYQSPNFLIAQKSDSALRETAAKLKYPMFTTPPRFLKGAAVQVVRLDGLPGLMVHAPGIMEFDVPEGAKRVSGKFGLLEGAYTGDGNTDGVEFIVEIKNRNGTVRKGFNRLLRPKSIPSDRGLMAFSIPLMPHDQKISLRTNIGQNMNGDYDWSVWSKVEIK